MSRKESEYSAALERYETLIPEINGRINELGEYSSEFCETLNGVRDAVNGIRNVPDGNRITFEKVEKIQMNFENRAGGLMDRLFGKRKVEGGAAAAATGVGVVTATAGPSMAMGIASVFGTASTGAAVSSLSGAAAANAALAWLGGGTIAAGGGGMAAGSALLAALGPIGWSVAGVALLGSGALILTSARNREAMEKIYTRILKRDSNRLSQALLEIDERINHIVKENDILREAVRDIGSFGSDYRKMTKRQKYALGSYVNQMNASLELLTKPVAGLEQVYTDSDYDAYLRWKGRDDGSETAEERRIPVINLANFLYSVELDENGKKLLWKELRNSSSFLEAMKLEKKSFGSDLLETALEALEFKRSGGRAQ